MPFKDSKVIISETGINKKMNEAQVLEIIGTGKLVAIVRLDNLANALELSEALLAGGITALEFTLTNPQALATLKQVKAELPQFERGEAVIGAGSVLDAQAAQASILAGAQFIVAPNTNFEVIRICRQANIAVMPGALTPTEIVQAWEAGASAVKLFPARAFGPAYLKDLREPLPHLKLLPTGGINLENVGEYLQNGAIAVGVGGNLVDKKLVAAQDWLGLQARAASYSRAVYLAQNTKK